MFVGFDNFVVIRDYYNEKFNVRHLPLIWDKVHKGFDPSIEYQWARNYECILFMTKGTKAFNDKAKLQPHRGDILRYEKVSSFNKIGINEKPLRLMEDLIELSSEKDERVLDPFCGTGTTGLACVRLGRRYLLMDNNEGAIKITKTRLLEEDFKDGTE